MINEAAAEGRSVAKSKGVKFGRPKALCKTERLQVIEQYHQGKSVAALALDFDVSRPVIYRTLKEVNRL